MWISRLVCRLTGGLQTLPQAVDDRLAVVMKPAQRLPHRGGGEGTRSLGQSFLGEP